jgi:hypothetical protein
LFDTGVEFVRRNHVSGLNARNWQRLLGHCQFFDPDVAMLVPVLVVLLLILNDSMSLPDQGCVS